MGYQINQINEQSFQILDRYNDCIYIIKGTSKSLVIDSGMDEDPIKEILNHLIDTPYEIIASHGHFDHVGRSGEFNQLFMDLKDRDVYLENFHMSDPHINKLSLIDMTHIKQIDKQYDLGDRIIRVVDCGGHTPGSVIIVDDLNKIVYTGDAIGSGCGVWMQVDHALSIKDYHQSLTKCLKELEQLDVNESWNFYGGHAYQEYQSRISLFNKFDIHILKDMITLCEKLLNHEIGYEGIQTTQFSTGKPYYSCYGKAEIIFTLSQL